MWRINGTVLPSIRLGSRIIFVSAPTQSAREPSISPGFGAEHVRLCVRQCAFCASREA